MALSNTKLVSWFSLAVIFTLAGFVGASAAPYQASFTGSVTFVGAPLAGTFNTTQMLSGSYTFDSAVPARAGSGSDFAAFDALTSFEFSIDGYSASSNAASEIQVDDAPFAPNDRYGVLSRASEGLTGADVGAFALSFFSFRLDDNTNTVFSDALILPTVIDLLDFDSTAFFVTFAAKSDLGEVREELVIGSIDSISIRPIPLPAALPLFAGGLGLLGLVTWRRRRKA